MARTQNTSITKYRSRMKRRGLVRVEVQVRREDAVLVRNVANALGDPARETDARALLRQQFGSSAAQGLKALLARAPLEAIDLKRSRDTGRAVDL